MAANETYPGRTGRADAARARPLSVAVVGATGLVGETLLRVLEERGFPVRELRPLASPGSPERAVEFRGRSQPVLPARAEAFDGTDLVFFAATGAVSRALAPEAARRGAIAIDKSSTWRMAPEVPLVIPEVNAAALARHSGIVACPNCTTIGVALVLEPLRALAGLARVTGTTLQAASGVGREGLVELEREEADLAQGRASEPRVFPAVLARNVIPQCDELLPDGRTLEEEKLARETRKILDLAALDVAMTCVRVPVPVGHAAALCIDTERSFETGDVLAALRAFPGLELVVDGPAPTARDAAGSDQVWVGRVRADPERRRIELWLVADNLRKGAATNSVQIAERLLELGGR